MLRELRKQEKQQHRK